jgi:hypothetical protein
LTVQQYCIRLLFPFRRPALLITSSMRRAPPQRLQLLRLCHALTLLFPYITPHIRHAVPLVCTVLACCHISLSSLCTSRVHSFLCSLICNSHSRHSSETCHPSCSDQLFVHAQHNKNPALTQRQISCAVCCAACWRHVLTVASPQMTSRVAQRSSPVCWHICSHDLTDRIYSCNLSFAPTNGSSITCAICIFGCCCRS